MRNRKRGLALLLAALLTALLPGTAWAVNQASAVMDLPKGVKYVPYCYHFAGEGQYQPDPYQKDSGDTYDLVSGTLPSGMSLDEEGELSGAPQAAGEFFFTVKRNIRDAVSQDIVDSYERTYMLLIEDNTTENVIKASEYQVLVPFGSPAPENSNHYILDSYEEQTLVIDAPYQDFTRLLIDGQELKEGEDYEVREGSTVITIRAQTFQRFGEGTHTLAEEFREGGNPSGRLKVATQNYTVKLKPGSGSSKPAEPSSPSTPEPDTSGDTSGSTSGGWPFGDVSPEQWFYPDVKWAYEGSIMTGATAASFAPNTAISQATIVTVLARMAKIDLTKFADANDSTIETGKWYTDAAVWAKQSGLLPDRSTFTGTATISREQMAIMLVKYLRSMGKDTAAPSEAAVFADAAEMSPDGNNAFQALYRYNIFQGVGDGRMDPGGSTTRAQFAALVHRVSEAAGN